MEEISSVCVSVKKGYIYMPENEHFDVYGNDFLRAGSIERD